MFNEPVEQPLRLTLSPRERDLILHNAVAVDRGILKKLRFGLRKGNRLAFDLSIEEFGDLVDALASKARHASSRFLRRRFARLHNRLSDVFNRCLTGAAGDGMPSADPMPPDFGEDLGRIFETHKFATLEEANEAVQQIAAAYNNRPREEFSGFSPAQVRRLLMSDWEGPDSALRLNENLPPAAVADARFFFNARTFLDALADAGGVKATQTGNLNRKFVQQMIDALRWPEDFVYMLEFLCKARNEQDVNRLHFLRVILDCAGLVRKRKGMFHITRKGEALLAEENAGALYALLFHAHFHKFNLAYMDGYPECGALQGQMTFSLAVLDRLAGDWSPWDDLVPRLILPAVRHEIEAWDKEHFLAGMARLRIIEPLEAFGLIECDCAVDVTPILPKLTRIRTTHLFDQFIRIEL